MAFRARKDSGAFKKQAPGLTVPWFPGAVYNPWTPWDGGLTVSGSPGIVAYQLGLFYICHESKNGLFTTSNSTAYFRE